MAIFTVTNNNDSGLGSLRQAIADANAAIGLDTIEFDNSLSGQEITLTSGELQITDDLNINGLGADLLTISGNNADRVFVIFDGDYTNDKIDVTLDGLTITEGNRVNGGGIYNQENLTVANSIVTDNAGTGIYHVGDPFNTIGSLNVQNSIISNNTNHGINSAYTNVTVVNSTISDNTNAGIIAHTQGLTVIDSTISDNTGGGISLSRVSIEIRNTTISGNTSDFDGGGIFGGEVFGIIANSTITNNTADLDGDGFGNGGGVNINAVDLVLDNTIIAGNFDNSPTGNEHYPDISGIDFLSNGYNFIGDITGLSINPFTETGDIFGTGEKPLDLDDFIGHDGIRVEAEDYVSYHDTTTGNTGGVYRNDDVDIENTTEIGGGFNVGYIEEGEWLTYDVDIPEDGLYQVVARVASNTTDGRIHHLDVSLDGEETSLDFEATGGWQSWIDVTGENLNLSAGSHELRFDMGSSGFNINYVDLIPLNGIRVEAEDYVTYSDTTPGNTGGEYRNDDVDIEVTTDVGGGFNVGYIEEGEWLTYDVDIPESGLYQVVARVASNTTDGRVHNLDISLDGESISLGFDATGGWQSWTDVIGDNLNLSAGSHELRLDMGSSGFNVNYIDIIRS